MKRAACLCMLGLPLLMVERVGAGAPPRPPVPLAAEVVQQDATGSLLPGVADGSRSGNVTREEERIRSAMGAAPPAVSAAATVLELPVSPGVAPVLLRSGNNGWTCFPDNPATPGPDPMCLDRQWMAWMEALREKRPPLITGPGIAYLLQGGSDASNDDPFATQPTSGETWMTAPPHIRLLSPQRWDASVYPARMDMQATGPWITFSSTPYEHLRVPVPTPAAGVAAPMR